MELTEKEIAEWDEILKRTKPLETNLSPVLPTAKNLSRETCCSEVDRIIKQFKILHDLPRVDGKRPDEYMHETFELLRQRCGSLHWRVIELDTQKYKKLHSRLAFKSIFSAEEREQARKIAPDYLCQGIEGSR